MFISTLKKIPQPLLTRTLLKPPPIFNKSYALIHPIHRNFARNFNKSNTSTTQKSPMAESSQTPREQTISGSTVTRQDVSLEQKPTENRILKEKKNFSKFMMKIYATTGLSFASTLGIASAVAASLPMTSTMISSLIVTGFITSVTGIGVFCSFPQDKVKEKLPNGKIMEKSVNPWVRKLAYSSLIVGAGITLSPYIKVVMTYNPIIIPMVTGLCVLTMTGAAIYAKFKSMKSFKAWEASMYGGLFGLVSINIISLLIHMMIGPNPLSYMGISPETFLGLGFFTAFLAIDTHYAVKAYRKGSYDHLVHAMRFFLTIKRIFVR